jgi:hypothetical protein
VALTECCWEDQSIAAKKTAVKKAAAPVLAQAST